MSCDGKVKGRHGKVTVAKHLETKNPLELQFEDLTTLQPSENVRFGRTPGDVHLAAQMQAHMQQCNSTLGRGVLPQAAAHKAAQAPQQI